MRGHTTQRGKTWTYWIDAGRDENGKRKQVTKGGFGTEREAHSAMRRVLTTIEDGGGYKKPSKETLATFMREWLLSAKSRTRPSTWATYETLTEKHIILALGGVHLQRLNTAQLNAFYGALLENGRRDGKGGLSPRTVGFVHAVLRMALGDAVRWERVNRNVADGATPPRKQRSALTTWSASEAQAFLSSVRDDRLYAAYALALTTGLRRGELLGLAWRDVELDAGWLHVRQTLISVNFKVQLSTPKTSAGRRSVALDPSTVEILRDHRLRQLRERHQLGLGAAQPDDLVFSGLEGQPLHPVLFSDTFDRRLRAAGVPRIRFHDLRHTYATLSLSAGISPKVVQERLGHTSVSITLDTYTHSIPVMQEEAAAKVAALLFESPVSVR